MFTTTNPNTTPAMEAEAPEKIPVVFVAADGGAFDANAESGQSYRRRLLKYSDFVLMNDAAPITLDLMSFMNPERDHKVGCFLCRFFDCTYEGLLARCDELWVFTQDGNVTKNMQMDIEEATRHHVPVRFFKDAEVDAFLKKMNS